MRWLAAALAAALAGQPATTSGIHELAASIPGVGRVLYAVSVPRGYDDDKPTPLVVALHPGGNARYYGGAFTRQVVEPGLRDLRPIILAPDCPAGSWTDPRAEQAVLALIENVMSDYNIDKRRLLVTGFSMGGRGTWFMSSRHPDLFTAAIPMAASIGNEPLDAFGSLPTYVIHSRDDERVPFGPAERMARELEKMGRPVHFEPVNGLTHYEMVRYVDVLRDGGRWVANRWKR